MKILIVCIQGLTSGILAKRMTDISHDHGDGHEFRACSQFDLDQYQEWADVILLTTQVRSIAKRVEDQYKKKKVLIISEESMAFSQVNTTYQQILRLISISNNKKLSWSTFLHVMENTLMLCLILSIPGWISFMVDQSIHSPLLTELYESTSSVICLYGACICGYYYAKETNQSRMTYVMLGFMSLLAMTPGMYSGDIVISEREFASIALPDYRFLMLLLYLPLIFISLYCFQHISDFIKARIFGKDMVLGDFNMIFFTLICTVNLGVLFLFRAFLDLIL